MASRLQLHNEFCTILESKNAYFNPPESVKMLYPAIVYTLSGIEQIKANNSQYRAVTRYTVTVIDYNPDSDIYTKLLARFPMCSFDRFYVANNLNHFVLTLYY